MSTLEVLEKLPATLMLKRTKIGENGKLEFLEEPEEFTLYISKLTQDYLKEFEGEKISEQFPNGAWVILYEYIGFEGRSDCYPVRLYNELKPLNIKEIINFPEEDTWSFGSGLIGTDLENMAKELLIWIEKNKEA